MTGKTLLTRMLLALGLAMFCLLAWDAHATPVEPNIRHILAHPATPPSPFATARAGWNGPESPSSVPASPNPILETFGVAAQRREMERGLWAAAVPDPRALAAILTAIVVLRRLRQRTPKPRLVERTESELMAA